MDAAGRPRPSWATFVYYYLAALVGLIVIVTGAVNVAQGLTTAIFPPDETEFVTGFGFSPGVDLQPSDPFSRFEEVDRTDGLRDALEGLFTAAVGVPVFWWHLNEARRREGDPPLRYQRRPTA